MRILTLAVLITFLFCGCGPLAAKYKEGDRIVSTVTGEEGQVIDRNCPCLGFSCEYQVRFPNKAPGAQNPFTTLWMKDVEMKPGRKLPAKPHQQ